ncbi:unnamed protein product [Orchesella dallaii]|uniref:Uncharacterized protein n=1 Tax=Orchesella dallaii TaxID=48710 RepID=A0ABP1PQW1_9HEXA
MAASFFGIWSLKGHSSDFLRIFFDFAYYLGICPYRFVIGKDGAVSVRSFKLQQIICATIHFLSLLNILIHRWHILLPEVEKRPIPAKYFFVLSHACSHLLNIFTFKQLWINRKDFSNIMTFLCSVYKVEKPGGACSMGKCCIKCRCGSLNKLLCILYLFTALFYVYEQVLEPIDFLDYPWPWQNYKLIQQARDMFSWDRNHSYRSDNENNLNLLLEPPQRKFQQDSLWYGFIATMLAISAITRSSF